MVGCGCGIIGCVVGGGGGFVDGFVCGGVGVVGGLGCILVCLFGFWVFVGG